MRVSGEYKEGTHCSYNTTLSCCASRQQDKCKIKCRIWNGKLFFFSYSYYLKIYDAIFITFFFSCLGPCLIICHTPPLPFSHSPVKTKYQSELKGRTWGFPLQSVVESFKSGFDGGSLFLFLLLLPPTKLHSQPWHQIEGLIARGHGHDNSTQKSILHIVTWALP